MAFLFSVITLVLGPFVYALGRRRPLARQILDGFVLITVAGIVCVYIIPDALAAGGLYAIVFLIIGLLFPVAIEKTFRHSLHKAHVFIVILAAAGLAIHAVIDGIALLPGVAAPSTERTNPGVFGSVLGNELALGVILHRLPVGMALWWSVRPALGSAAAIGTFALIIAATALAYFFGGPVVDWAETRVLAYLQAFVAGSLVHVVAFGVSHEHDSADASAASVDSWGYRVGILLAMFLVFTTPHIH